MEEKLSRRNVMKYAFGGLAGLLLAGCERRVTPIERRDAIQEKKNSHSERKGIVPKEYGPSPEKVDVVQEERKITEEDFYGEWDVTEYEEYWRYRIGGPIDKEPTRSYNLDDKEIGFKKFLINAGSIRFLVAWEEGMEPVLRQAYQTEIRSFEDGELKLDVISGRGTFSENYIGFRLRLVGDRKLEITREPNSRADERTIFNARRHK